MSILDNINIATEIENYLDKKLPIRLGINKKNELVRLIYEISQASGLSVQDVFKKAEIEALIEKDKNGLFHSIKEALLKLRYPSFEPGLKPHLMPLKINKGREECLIWDYKLEPKNIFVEKGVKDLEWTRSFVEKFPKARYEIIDSRWSLPPTPIGSGNDIPCNNSVKIYNKRRENIFLIKNKSAFVKICPCTKGYKRCRYWILNLGFGCPIDCSYCYLQLYSNAPGLILTANIEDYYAYIKQLDKKVAQGTRIGTGEFTDSLALDRYTGYSKKLIPFFRSTKRLVLELKTKISDIDSVLEESSHENVVISWSINTRKIAERHEKGGASITERISAANRAAERGYRIGFHFDPIVYYNEWEDEYRAIVDELFSYAVIRHNTSWISLGTLRYTPALKQIAEQRFSDNLLFYEGEFFEDTDGKLRYPRKLRLDIYDKMTKWIRAFNNTCWVYLCMEPKEFCKGKGVFK